MASRKVRPLKENRNRSGSDPQDIDEQEEPGKNINILLNVYATQLSMPG